MPENDAEIEAELDRVFGPNEPAEKGPMYVYHGPMRPRSPKRKIAAPEAPPLGEMVNRPNHYARWKIEPIHFLMENEVNAFQFNIIKYVMRAEFKNGLEDIKKMLRYGEMYLKKMAGDPDWSKTSTMVIPGFYP